MSLQIRLEELVDGPVQRTETLPASALAERLGEGFDVTPAGFSVELRVVAAARVVEAACSVHGELALGCSRCGDPILLPIHAGFTHRFVPHGKLDAGPMNPEAALFGADPDISEHDGTTVNLEPLCVEYALLALPFAPTCADRSEGPCEQWSDKPAHFGDELPDDEPDNSPWAVLRSVTPVDSQD